MKIWPPRRRKDRKGKPWVVAWVEGGKREHKTFGKDRAAAQEFYARKSLDLGQPMRTLTVPRDVTVKAFADHWLKAAAPGLKRNTYVSYESALRLKIIPAIGDERIRDVHQRDGVNLLSTLLKEHAEGTVRTAYQVLRRLFQRAKFEGVISDNPMQALWVELPISVKSRRQSRKRSRDEARTKALTRSEVAVLLAEEQRLGGDQLLAVAYRAGLRIGEALGLQFDDADPANAELTVRRRLEIPRPGVTLEQRIGDPKTGHERTIDLGPEAVEILRATVARRREQNLSNGWTSPWIFVDKAGAPRDYFAVRLRMTKILKAASLPLRFTPHSLRHSYATHMLELGAPIAWVAKQLGDRIETLLAWYWWALPSGDKRFAGLIDTATNDNQNQALAVGGDPYLIDRAETASPDVDIHNFCGRACEDGTTGPDVQRTLEPPVDKGERKTGGDE